MRVAETAGGTCLCLHIDVCARVCDTGYLFASIIRLSMYLCVRLPIARVGVGESICARLCLCVCVCVMN